MAALPEMILKNSDYPGIMHYLDIANGVKYNVPVRDRDAVPDPNCLTAIGQGSGDLKLHCFTGECINISLFIKRGEMLHGRQRSNTYL